VARRNGRDAGHDRVSAPSGFVGRGRSLATHIVDEGGTMMNVKTVTTLACALGLFAATAACDRADYDRDTAADNPAAIEDPADPIGTAGAGMPRVADIVGNPSDYAGKSVTLIADVEEVFGPRAFALDEDAPLAGGVDRDLLVLSKKASNLSDIDDQWLNNKVRVTGTVQRWSLVEIEREVGWDLEPQIETELEGAGAVLIADSITRVNP
jgi:hypothetical protein